MEETRPPIRDRTHGRVPTEQDAEAGIRGRAALDEAVRQLVGTAWLHGAADPFAGSQRFDLAIGRSRVAPAAAGTWGDAAATCKFTARVVLPRLHQLNFFGEGEHGEGQRGHSTKLRTAPGHCPLIPHGLREVQLLTESRKIAQ